MIKSKLFTTCYIVRFDGFSRDSELYTFRGKLLECKVVKISGSQYSVTDVLISRVRDNDIRRYVVDLKTGILLYNYIYSGSHAEHMLEITFEFTAKYEEQIITHYEAYNPIEWRNAPFG